jgi:Zn-dependent metalloprotease
MDIETTLVPEAWPTGAAGRAGPPSGYSGQTGALNEHLSDAFGIMVKQYKLGQSASESDWLIGAELFGPAVNGKGVRSMAARGTAYDDRVLGVAR